LAGGATMGTAVSQISALHDTFLFIVLLMMAALVTAVWGWVQERGLRSVEAG
jgi:hypothetical protein